MLAHQKKQVTELIQAALVPILADSNLIPVVTLERPRDATHGDLACNIAMQLAKQLRQNPRELAQKIITNVQRNSLTREVLDAIEIAGPGFINVRMSATWKQKVVNHIIAQGRNYGANNFGAGEKVLVEFVSANPTGPLHVGHGRQGALGDALAGLLQSQGFDVTREFYYNDAGVQIHNLALSVQARAKGLGLSEAGWPEAAYKGAYIGDIAADYLGRNTISCADSLSVHANGDPDDLESIRQFSVAYLRREQDCDLLALGIKFDSYYLESSLYEEGRVDSTVNALVGSGKTFELDGALWLRTTEFGDDKDRVMRKSDGTYTYFVPDVAYHIVKWQRGFAKAINVQGGDHHGTIARVRAGLQAAGIGVPEGYPAYVLHKMVTVVKNGQEVKISKRAGSYVTVRDLIEWSGAGDQMKGRDAVRFFLISRKADTEFVFDIDVAQAKSDENPVYYVQYAHARICSVLAQWGGDEKLLSFADLSPLTSPKELGLLGTLAAFPEILERATIELGPHLVAFYLRDLAGELHAYYNSERVLVDDMPTKMARLALMCAVRQVLRNGLDLIGVSAPIKM